MFQLFKKPHPPKRVRSKANGDVASIPPSSNSDKIFFHHLDNLRPSLAPVKGSSGLTRPTNYPQTYYKCETTFQYIRQAYLYLFPPPGAELKEPVGQIVCTDKGILAVEQNKVLVPPTWSKTFAWGYADLSCRLANYESDKVSYGYCDDSFLEFFDF